jgi:hypothetical protein
MVAVVAAARAPWGVLGFDPSVRARAAWARGVACSDGVG